MAYDTVGGRLYAAYPRTDNAQYMYIINENTWTSPTGKFYYWSNGGYLYVKYSCSIDETRKLVYLADSRNGNGIYISKINITTDVPVFVQILQ